MSMDRNHQHAGHQRKTVVGKVWVGPFRRVVGPGQSSGRLRRSSRHLLIPSNGALMRKLAPERGDLLMEKQRHISAGKDTLPKERDRRDGESAVMKEAQETVTNEIGRAHV